MVRAMSAWGVLLTIVSAGQSFDHHGGLRFRVQAVHGRVLPYQGVRLGLTLSHHGRSPVATLVPLEGYFTYLVGVERDGVRLELTKRFESIWPEIPQTYTIPGNIPFPHDNVTAARELRLAPGEREHLTRPVCAFWPTGAPIFAQPGRYSLLWKYYSDWLTTPRGVMWYRCDVEVAVPDGDDAEILRMLKENSGLANAMLSPLTWTGERASPWHHGPLSISPSQWSPHKPPTQFVRRLLEHIVKDYPKSSYADYARFALARAEVGGNFLARSAEFAAKARARKWLDGIDYDRFAFAPSALILLKDIADDAVQAQKVRARIEKTFAHTYEWYRHQAESLAEDELSRIWHEWSTQRIRKPVGPRWTAIVDWWTGD